MRLPHAELFTVDSHAHVEHRWRLQIRGVPVGSVLSVQPSLEQVNVLVEIKEPTTVIPRNSLIEANQSGLIAESLIDITPQLPIPDYKVGTLQPQLLCCLLFATIRGTGNQTTVLFSTLAQPSHATTFSLPVANANPWSSFCPLTSNTTYCTTCKADPLPHS